MPQDIGRSLIGLFGTTSFYKALASAPCPKCYKPISQQDFVYEYIKDKSLTHISNLRPCCSKCVKNRVRHKIDRSIWNVWNTYIGKDKVSTLCPMGCGRMIYLQEHEKAHVDSECEGGSKEIENLRPICSFLLEVEVWELCIWMII